MGQTLTGNAINTSYQGLAKTEDNAAIGATEKNITDGLGNASTLNLGTNSASFTGTLDLSGATVTGLPADVNTTYDLASAQNGANVEVTLTGSDATTDTVTLVAGTNVTLADDGSNNITVTTADTNYTYTYTLSQNGANVDLELAGTNGGSNSEVQIQPGTNITLTQNGPTSFVIDAAGGAAGLESGTGTDSMQSAASLTTTGADAAGTESIALGQNADAVGNQGIAIGKNSVSAEGAVAVGEGATTNTWAYSTVLGREAAAVGAQATAIGFASDAGASSFAGGRLAQATGGDSVAIGNTATSSAGSSVAIGNDARATGGSNDGCIAIGKNVDATGNRAIAICPNNGTSASNGSIAIGADCKINASADRHIAIGTGINTVAGSSDAISIGASANADAQRSIALGQNSQSTAINGVALGYGVINSIGDTVSIKALEVQTDSTPTAGGIIMSDAGGTDRRINITSTGDLQIDSTPVLAQTNTFATGGQTAPMSGYGATYWTSCSLITGRPAINGAMPDQGANIAMLTKFDIDYTKTVNTIGVPMPTVTSSENLYVAVYESASNGGPGVRVWEETKAITASDNNTWVEVALSSAWTPEKGKSYWIGAMTPSGSSAAALGYMGGEHASAQRFTTTNNSSVGTMICIHTLRVVTAGSGMPTDLSSTTFGHRDEEVFFAWK